YNIDQVGWVCLFLPDIAPFAVLVPGINGGHATLLPSQIDVFESFEKEQIRDLLHCHQRVGETSGPKPIPEVVNCFLYVGCEHLVGIPSSRFFNQLIGKGDDIINILWWKQSLDTSETRQRRFA